MGQSRPLTSNRVVQRRLAPGPVQCLRCAAEWPTDPALSLACPRCLAVAGEPCRRPLGGNENACIARDVLAMQAGRLSRCQALTWDGRHSKPLPLACEIVHRAGAAGGQVSAP
jgi:hypothetical protein